LTYSGEKMRVNADAKIRFTVLFSDHNSANLNSCQKVTRENMQTVTLEIPESVVKIMEALKESKTLSLILNIGEVYISRDKVGAGKSSPGVRWWG
jgi:hypothetical protein